MYVLYDDLKYMVVEKHVREYLNVVTFMIHSDLPCEVWRITNCDLYCIVLYKP